MGNQMKLLVMIGVLLLVGVGSAHAQSNFSNLGGSVGGGSSINDSSSVNHSGSINTSSAGTGSVSDSRVYKNVEATNPGAYVPSTYENYDAAVTMGRNAGLARPLTIVEAARMAQQAKEAGAAKPPILLEKDAAGKLIVVQPNIQAKK
jgi:hypothetical protein